MSITIAGTLIWWGVGRAVDYDVRFGEMVANPGAYIGQKVFVCGRIVAKDSERITLVDRGEEILLSFTNKPEMAEMPLQGVLTGEGVFTANGVIEVTEYRYQQFRDIKVWLSLIITPVMLLVFLWKFRWDWGRKEFVGRDA
ncbi:hypothetical protein KJ596_03920 [Patescibacteria group bacterium]|nr:hypothetical protein [Patescibacteria group bacterium]MBU1868068.1 hypothetical protein [Patescibacteria group bacterium]